MEPKSHRIGAILWIHTRAIEQKADRRESLALTLAEGVHELGEGSGAFNFEEHLVVVVCDFNVEMLGFRLLVLWWGATGRRLLAMVGHIGVPSSMRGFGVEVR